MSRRDATRTSGWGRVATRFRQRPLSLVAAAFLLTVIAVAAAAPLIDRYDPNSGSFADTLHSPSWKHWLGTDRLGRDTWARLVHGSRVAVLAACEAVAVGLAIGIPLGLALGYFRGWIDRIGMRLVEAVVAVPGLVVAIALMSVLGSGITRAMLAIGVVFSTIIARLVRGEVLSAREQLYVDSARVVGTNDRRIMFAHLLPNIAPTIIVQTTLLIAAAILAEAGLSFLGLGVVPPTASWGVMLSDAQESLGASWALVLAPGLAILFTVLAANIVGDGLRDAFAGERGGRAIGSSTVERSGTTTRAPAARLRTAEPAPLLAAEALFIDFPDGRGGWIETVSDVSLSISPGEVVGLVGESGSGKSITAMALLGLVPSPGRARAASIRFDETELAGAPDAAVRAHRGTDIAVVFQEPIAALNPTATVGRQIAEVLARRGVTGSAARAETVALLERVGISDAVHRCSQFPHQFSGGMAQRVMIAMALAGRPRLLIADEPTTALDVTVQGQILDLLHELRREEGLAILLITHDLGVVADIADRVAVMYGGEVVEVAPVSELFHAPRHPYSAALLDSVPRTGQRTGRLVAIPGAVPLPKEFPEGCRFSTRCAHVTDACRSTHPEVEVDGDRMVRCIRAAELLLTGSLTHPPAPMSRPSVELGA